MTKYKNIRVKKKGGGTRMQRVQVLKSGKYKFVKNKKSGRKITKSSGGKKSPSKKKGGNTTTYRNKMTAGRVHYQHALAGSGIHYGTAIMRGYDPKSGGYQALRTYTGYDFQNKKLELGELWRGYGGTANEMMYRKLCKGIGVEPYPRKPKKGLTVSNVLDYACMYGVPIATAYENRGNPHVAHKEVYKKLYGVDLSQKGGASYQPANMLETKGIFLLKKTIFKLARGMGAPI